MNEEKVMQGVMLSVSAKSVGILSLMGILPSFLLYVALPVLVIGLFILIQGVMAKKPGES
ncbi:MAG: hypothetical protein KKA79_10435 [Nanoarchaeota archaeon]|nr:hypothetical protein [Nanoarchaeota archaeon]